MATIMLAACERDVSLEESEVSIESILTKKFIFTCKGDFESPSFTRGYLTASDNALTDLWVFDYVGSECVQSIHQSNTEANWGQPQLQLSYGSHKVYFVASRGTEPTVDATAKTITWTKPSDTFWKSYEVEVVSTSNGNRAVTLDRVATKLKITAIDEVPTGAASVVITPSVWYNGLNYTTGEAASPQYSKDRVINIPASYIGTTKLSANVFGISSETEWTTNISVSAMNQDGEIIGHVDITDAPFKRARATEYSGCLFQGKNTFSLIADTEWEESIQRTW